MLLRTLQRSIRCNLTPMKLCCRVENVNKKCWKCGHICCSCSVHCLECKAIQFVTDCDYYDLFKLEPSFELDEGKLDAKYKDLQKQLHPDLFSTKTPNEKDVSLQSSTAVNQAYQTLRDPIHRAMYILSREHINVFEESQSYRDPQLMNEIFELREGIDDIMELKQAEALMAELSMKMKVVEQRLQSELEKKDMNTFARDAVRLKYYSKVLAEAVLKKEAFAGN